MYKGTPLANEINRRFAEALTMLKDNGTIRGLRTFTEQHELNYWNMTTFVKDPDGRILKPEWIAFLVEDYGISADWILLGIGPMYRQFSF